MPKIPPFHHVPNSVPGGAFEWCEENGMSLYHAEGWSEDQRARYEARWSERAPCRSPYMVPCPCHPLRLGSTTLAERWKSAAEALAWLRENFTPGGKKR